MALIVRIDVDRPYGREGFVRHVASRISSDYSLPQMQWLGYLDELKTILGILSANGKSAHVFFRLRRHGLNFGRAVDHAEQLLFERLPVELLRKLRALLRQLASLCGVRIQKTDRFR